MIILTWEDFNSSSGKSKCCWVTKMITNAFMLLNAQFANGYACGTLAIAVCHLHCSCCFNHRNRYPFLEKRYQHESLTLRPLRLRWKGQSEYRSRHCCRPLMSLHIPYWHCWISIVLFSFYLHEILRFDEGLISIPTTGSYTNLCRWYDDSPIFLSRS